MKLTTTWKEKMCFDTTDGQLSTLMDAKSPIGQDRALSPKQLCLAAITGCTGMDVVAWLRKHKQELQKFHIAADATVVKAEPAIFSEVQLDFYLEGSVEKDRAIEAVHLSQTKYCGVSAMIAKACPIRYRVHLNGEKIGEGEAKF